jgi:hypothetical protein
MATGGKGVAAPRLVRRQPGAGRRETPEQLLKWLSSGIHRRRPSLQIISTVLARWPVCSELTAASVFSAAQGHNFAFLVPA